MVGRPMHGLALKRPFLCPVCGLNSLPIPKEIGPTCPACGTDYETDYPVWSIQTMRSEWIAAGAPWFSSVEAPPSDWDTIRRRIVKDGI